MTIDGDIASIIGVFSAIASSSVTYGIMKEKIRRIEKDTEQNDEKYVSKALYISEITQIKNAVFEIERDIKKILQTVRQRHER